MVNNAIPFDLSHCSELGNPEGLWTIKAQRAMNVARLNELIEIDNIIAKLGAIAQAQAD